MRGRNIRGWNAQPFDVHRRLEASAMLFQRARCTLLHRR